MEQIQDEAMKCRFCGELLPEEMQGKRRWYHQTRYVVIGFLVVGPLILPLLLANPRISRNAKIVWSVIMLLLTYYMTAGLMWSLKQLKEYYQLILNI